MPAKFLGIERFLVEIDRGSSIADEMGRQGRNRTIIDVWHGSTISQFEIDGKRQTRYGYRKRAALISGTGSPE